MFFKLCIHETHLNLLKQSNWLYFICFIVVSCTLIVLSQSTGSAVSVGWLWILLLFASILMNGDIFQMDIDSGIIQQLARIPLGLESLISAKLLAQWGITSLFLWLAIPVIEQFAGMEQGVEAISLFLGYWCLLCLSAISSLLARMVTAGKFLIPLLMLPLATPIIIFGSGSGGQIALGGTDPQTLLLAIVLCLTPLCIFAGGGALRIVTR